MINCEWVITLFAIYNMRFFLRNMIDWYICECERMFEWELYSIVLIKESQYTNINMLCNMNNNVNLLWKQSFIKCLSHYRFDTFQLINGRNQECSILLCNRGGKSKKLEENGDLLERTQFIQGIKTSTERSNNMTCSTKC